LIPVYSDRSSWSKWDPNKFHEGIERAGRQVVAYFAELGVAQKSKITDPKAVPQILGNFCVP
tara:strand:- start:62 stop:247 length:186 start_codon:yes stop_codon:yes gene_type:complete